MPTYLLLQYGKIGNESKDITVPHGAFGYIGVTLNVYTHVGLDDASKELEKMQGLETARKEMGLSDKDDHPISQKLFKAT